MTGWSLRLPRVERSERGRVLAGVCSGVAEQAAVDATVVRLAFALLAFAAGAGVVAYLGAWALLPAPGGAPAQPRRRTLGALLLVASAFLVVRGVGLADSLVWPVALVAVGLTLVQRGRASGDRTNVLAGAALGIVGVGVFVSGNAHGGRAPLLAPGAVAVALLLVLGPWAWRLLRERDAERTARIRTEERAEVAARVHDSVLQTLALIQREADDPRRVATLARQQERELRGWLYPQRDAGGGAGLAHALEAAAAEVEELHGVRVEIVRTGDAPLDERVEALVLAAREALANAAAHSGAEDVSVFVDAGEERIAVYVRDRGRGFAPDAVPSDRRGLAESIRGRMARAGGSAKVTAAPGEGVEVELVLPRRT